MHDTGFVVEEPETPDERFAREVIRRFGGDTVSLAIEQAIAAASEATKQELGEAILRRLIDRLKDKYDHNTERALGEAMHDLFKEAVGMDGLREQFSEAARLAVAERFEAQVKRAADDALKTLHDDIMKRLRESLEDASRKIRSW